MHFVSIDQSSHATAPGTPMVSVNTRELFGLTAIFEPQVQIAVFERTANPAISHYLQALQWQGTLRGSLREFVKPGETFQLARWDELPGRRALEDDINFLITAYADLMGCVQVGLRIEVLESAMCPRFHVDRTGIRLLCTYRGPGTDWLDDRYANRAFLGAGAQGVPDDHSGLIGSSDAVHGVAPFAVALLKGEAWQGNEGHGVIHRSPPVSTNEGPRVLLALDAIW